MQDMNILGFYHEYEANGYMSNWYRSDFEYCGRKYFCIEQYMMYQKVIMFHQFQLAQQIPESNDPLEIKRLGRTRFPEFNAAVWDNTSYTIVKRGIRAKFEQNPDLLKQLLSTGEKILAECSANDTKWGIGNAIDDDARYDPKCWRGTNFLGRILMEVRDELRTLAAVGNIGCQDARDVMFPLWNALAGTLQRNPKFHATVNAYADTLKDDVRLAFFYDATLAAWENSIRNNVDGVLPSSGFWELKQDIFDILRLSSAV